MGKGFSKSWDSFPTQQSEGPNLSSFSLLVDSCASQVNEQVVVSEPSFEHCRPSSIVPGPREAANPIDVLVIVPLPNLVQATNEIFPIAGQGSKGPVEGKRRKINKEKLKAVLAAIDGMEDEDMEEVHYDPSNIQHISSPTNPDTSCVDNTLFLDTVARKEISSHGYDSDFIDSPVSVASHDSTCFSDKNEMNNSIFSWESYDCFTQFCGKIGITLHDKVEAKNFLNTIRAQHFFLQSIWRNVGT